MNEPRYAVPDITSCDREPIHIPGSIQPHGVLVVVEPASLRTVGEAGEVSRFIPAYSRGTEVSAFLIERLCQRLEGATTGKLTPLGRVDTPAGAADVVA